MSRPDNRLNDPALVAREYATTDRLAVRRLDHTGWLRADGEEAWEIALRAVAERHPRDVLDVGCGTGEFASLIAAPNVCCVDTSPAAVAQAAGLGLRASEADAQSLPFRDGSFDVVVCNWLLYHVPNRERAIAEMARVLRTGGRFVGCYNAPGHLAELWHAVGRVPSLDDFNAEIGPRELAAAFRGVEMRWATGLVLWERREDLQSYLEGYAELYGPLTAPTEPYPFRATRKNVVLLGNR